MTDKVSVEVPGISYENLKLIKLLGNGGFGCVYLARHDKFGHVAVKLLLAREALHERLKQELSKEARTIRKLNHQNIITLRGVCYCDQNQFYSIVLEYAQYGNIWSVCSKYDPLMEWRCDAMHDVLSAMIYIHSSKLRHLDLKANNILVAKSFVVKLADFGLSKWRSTSEAYATENNSNQGTISHICPEALRVSQATDKWDVYSFGITVWEVLSGKKPYYGCTSEEIKKMLLDGKRPFDIQGMPEEAPRLFQNLIIQCCQIDPEHRPEFIAVKRDLSELCEDEEFCTRVEVAAAKMKLQAAAETVASETATNQSDDSSLELPPMRQTSLMDVGNFQAADPSQAQPLEQPCQPPDGLPQQLPEHSLHQQHFHSPQGAPQLPQQPPYEMPCPSQQSPHQPQQSPHQPLQSPHQPPYQPPYWVPQQSPPPAIHQLPCPHPQVPIQSQPPQVSPYQPARGLPQQFTQQPPYPPQQQPHQSRQPFHAVASLVAEMDRMSTGLLPTASQPFTQSYDSMNQYLDTQQSVGATDLLQHSVFNLTTSSGDGLHHHFTQQTVSEEQRQQKQQQLQQQQLDQQEQHHQEQQVIQMYQQQQLPQEIQQQDFKQNKQATLTRVEAVEEPIIRKDKSIEEQIPTVVHSEPIQRYTISSLLSKVEDRLVTKEELDLVCRDQSVRWESLAQEFDLTDDQMHGVKLSYTKSREQIKSVLEQCGHLTLHRLLQVLHKLDYYDVIDSLIGHS